MAAPQASSRLEMLQARFQQKQLQEKEQKLLQLYDQQQQRAYQVAQRGTSGSNSSGQGTSTVNHHHQIVTRTSSSGHTTSTSQATKVKQQVFNDRRQTTSVKGIDRSYPLEPLDNKTRKQPTSNGIGNSRNNGLTVNRQSITVKRVTRSDLNSNVNDGKPIVSYHEETTRESSSSRDVPRTIESPKEDDIELFDNGNHTTHYVNGNYPDQVQMENIMDEDTIQRNRMMAKLHLMQYDETLKYRVKNDLESEEFPEDLLLEVTDKIPKRTVSKKLSQAEARLERFKNMNAKRNNAIKVSNSTTIRLKKRSEPLLPSSRTNSRIGVKGVKTTTTSTTTTTSKKNKKKPGNIGEKQSNKFKIGKGSAKYDRAAFEKSKTEETKSKRIRYDRKTGTSNETFIFQKGKTNVPGQNETIDPTDNPTFFSNESKISIDTLDYKHGKSKPLSNTKRHIQNRDISSTKVNNFPITTASNNDKRSYVTTHGKNDSTTFSPNRRSYESSTTLTTNRSESNHTTSPELIRNLKKRDMRSPEFVYVETEKSATTMSLKPKSTNSNEGKGRDRVDSSRDFQSKMSQKTITKQSPSYLKLERNIRKSSDSSETSNKSSNLEFKSQRGSIRTLRSIQLIRNAMKKQNLREEDNTKNDEDHLKIHSIKYSKENELRDCRKPFIDPVRKHYLKIDVRDVTDLKNATDRERKFSFKNFDRTLQLSPKSSKSFISAEFDTEIQEITMTDQRVRYKNTVCKNPKEKRRKNSKSITDETYSKSSATKLQTDDKKTNLLTYPIRKEKKKARTSILDSNIFHLQDETDKVRRFKKSNRSLSKKSWEKEGNKGRSMDLKGLTSSELNKRHSSENKNERIIVSLGKRRNIVDLKNIKNESTRSKSSSSICTNDENASKNRTTNVSLKDITFDESRKEIQKRSSSPFLYKRVIRTSSEDMKSETANKELFKSTELIRSVIRAQSSDKQYNQNRELTEPIKHNESFDRFSNQIPVISLSSNANYYGRTDSVESALRRFDSIGAEFEYQETIGQHDTTSSSKISLEEIPITKLRKNEVKELTETKTRVLESSKVEENRSKSDSRKNKKNVDVNVYNKSPNISNKILPTRVETSRHDSKRKKVAEARDSMEISRTSKLRSLASCKRKLFQDFEESEKTKIGRVGCTLENSFKTENKINLSRRKSMEISTTENEKNKSEKKKKDKEDEDQDDRTVTVKPLRSIEDIRKSIVCDSSGRTVVALTQITDIDLGRQAETRSAIANEILKASNKSESQSRIVVDSDPLNRKIIPTKNLSKNNSQLRDYGKILSANSLRLNRINKSPSPESINSKKSSDVDCRFTTVLTRRSVPSSPSKSPDILPRRVSTLESKTQETKPSIKSSFVKASDSITSKRSTTRTDVPNPLQNGLHSQEQIVERKEQNELPKKCQAFTIDFEERPSSKTNDSTDSKRPLAKKQSVEKQQQQQHQTSSPAISGRPTSSTSSASNGNPTQTQISSSKGRMATRARTPISNTPTSKGSSYVKSGTGQNATENLSPCKVCGRRFAQDRVTLHEQICAKTVQKKRKQFDTTMYRVKGTELESFVKKNCKKYELKSKKPEVKSNWRRKHEEFINAIRSAKQVQAHLAAGGRLSDLPPPPVSDTSDYIQCPHCGRKFNQAAAERHIPKCEHMLHNKPSSRAAPPRPRR